MINPSIRRTFNKLFDVPQLQQLWCLSSSVSFSKIVSRRIKAEESKDIKPLKHRVSLEKMLLLNIYKEEYENLLVKRTYSIPSYSPWPDWSHGFRLGAEVGLIRSFYKKGNLSSGTIDELNKIGFVWDFYLHKYRKTIAAIRLYAKITKEDLSKMPYTFSVPFRHKKWPREFWGLKLGQVIKNVRNRPESRLAQVLKPLLDEHSFDFDKQKGNYDLLRECLMVYKDLHGDLNVPESYFIPTTSTHSNSTDTLTDSPLPSVDPSTPCYPKAMEGKNLGQIVSQLRYRQDYQEHREELAALGLSLTPKKHSSFCLASDALQWYVHTLQLPVNEMKTTYKVPGPPADDNNSDNVPLWPADPQLWGLKLGKLLWDIRRRRTYKEYEQHWSSLGIEFVEHDKLLQRKKKTKRSSSNNEA